MSTEVALSWDAGKFAFQRRLSNFVQYFQVTLPSNAQGIPLQLIDPTVMAENLLDHESPADLSDEKVNRAIVDVNYDDGMPLFEGTPIWERLDGEAVDFYKFFKHYREMLYLEGSRAISRLANTLNVQARELILLSKIYHWQLRCKAFDYYKKQEAERKRMFEVEKLESKHSRAADQLLEQALTYLDTHSAQLNPKVALQMLEASVKIGRLSLGLPADKPLGVAEAGATNIQINNGGSANENAAQESYKEMEEDKLASVLSILDRSGALDKMKIVEAEYTVVSEESNDSPA